MYSVQIEKQALKYINKLDRTNARRIRDAIDLLAGDPSLGKHLTNHSPEYSYRVGDFSCDLLSTFVLCIFDNNTTKFFNNLFVVVICFQLLFFVFLITTNPFAASFIKPL